VRQNLLGEPNLRGALTTAIAAPVFDTPIGRDTQEYLIAFWDTEAGLGAKNVNCPPSHAAVESSEDFLSVNMDEAHQSIPTRFDTCTVLAYDGIHAYPQRETSRVTTFYRGR
jgi:hypothetical protein